MCDNSVERINASEGRIAELETELAFTKRQLEKYENPSILLGDVYSSAPYWRERCLKAENELNVLRCIYADSRNREASK